MKPELAPHVPSSTEAERFDNAVRKMFSVSKTDLQRSYRKCYFCLW